MTAKLMRSTFNDSFIIMSLLCKVLGYIMQLFLKKKRFALFYSSKHFKAKKVNRRTIRLVQVKIYKPKKACMYFLRLT